jgi:hypothetical protein
MPKDLLSKINSLNAAKGIWIEANCNIGFDAAQVKCGLQTPRRRGKPFRPGGSLKLILGAGEIRKGSHPNHSPHFLEPLDAL